MFVNDFVTTVVHLIHVAMKDVSQDAITTRFLAANRLLQTEIFDDCYDTCKLLSQFTKHFKTIAKLAPNYDVLGVSANGHRSLCRLWLRLFEVAIEQRYDPIVRVEFKRLLKYMLTWFASLSRIRAAENLPYGAEDIDITRDYFRAFADVGIEAAVRPAFFGALFSRESRLTLRSFVAYAILTAGKGGLGGRLAAMLSFGNLLGHYRTFLKGTEPAAFRAVFGSADHWLVARSMNVFKAARNLIAPLTSTRHNVRLGSQWRITCSPEGIGLQPEVDGPRRVLTYRAVRSEATVDDDRFDGAVLVHLKGGAFFGPSGDFFEVMYLRTLAEALPGVTILNLDYSLCPEVTFPTALQECLDFYQWVQSRCTDVVEQLGFRPGRIVLSGESSGGNLASALTIVLNDIRRLAPSRAIAMPKCLVTLFPRENLRGETLPSHWLSPLDVLVSPSLQGAVATSYIPYRQRGADGRWKSCHADGNPRWFDMDAEPIDSPYLTPYAYDKFDELADVPLRMLVLHFCPFLDEGLELVRRWKGAVELKAVDNNYHACISYAVLSPELAHVAKEMAAFIGEAF